MQRAGRRTGTRAHRRRGGGQAHDSTGRGAQHRAELRAVGGAQSERGRGRQAERITVRGAHDCHSGEPDSGTRRGGGYR